MGLYKPSTARGKVTIDSLVRGNSYQLATSAHEIVALLATAGGGALFVSIYDDANGGKPQEDRVVIAANQGESTPFTPAQPLYFKKGLYIVFEQGGTGQGGGKITIVYN